ncbi:MAG: AAA family ATPase [Acidobacteria bacterium]|nr:AAA family ATPase [Acidobacteriota bacterium]
MSDNKLKVVGPTQQWDEDLRKWLESYIREHPHLTTAVLSREQHIGISRTALDNYIEGLYFLPKESGGMGVSTKGSKVEPQIRAYREKVEGTVRHGYANTFVDTRAWVQLQQACATAITENVIVVVYGKPGVGKSRGITEFAVRKMTTSPVTILCSANVTTRYFVQRLAQALGLDDRLPTAKLEDSIAEKLKRSPRPIFIDQANYLNEKALGTICYVWEKARVPFVLIGTHDLFDLFNTSRLTEDVRAQLSSRVAMHYPLAELSVAEVKAIIERALGDAATEEVISAIYNVTGGIHRHVDMIVPRINELAARNNNKEKLQRGEISMTDIVQTAGHRLMVG